MASLRGYREPFVIQVRICADVDRYTFSIPLRCQRAEEMHNEFAPDLGEE